MANNYSFPSANFPAQPPDPRQPGHWSAYLLGARQTPPPPTQQRLNVALANHLLDGGQLRQEDEESSGDDDNIDPRLRMQNQHMGQVLQPPLPTQGVPTPGQCFTLFLR
jgi:hypothetical protein